MHDAFMGMTSDDGEQLADVYTILGGLLWFLTEDDVCDLIELGIRLATCNTDGGFGG